MLFNKKTKIMKKQLLIVTGVLVSGLLNAQVANRAAKIPNKLANIAVLKSNKADDKLLNAPIPFQTKGQVAAKKSQQRVSAITEVVIGNSYYDLQTNSSIGDRIVLNADGTIATCWTFESTADGGVYNNRGTGYAYYNGSAWSAAPTAKVENARVGWGNVVNTRSGRELILSHNGTTSKMHVASRSAKGNGVWANSETVLPTANSGGNYWPRMVTSSVSGGDTIYAVSLTYPTTGTPPGQVYQGLDGAVVFSRSVNQGVSWDIVNQVPDGLTSTDFIGHGPDTYAIAAKGSTVVIATGDNGKDLVLTKSTDAGATWTAKTVLKFPIAKYNSATTTTDINSDNVADTLTTTDGSIAVALDNNGLAYVSYGGMRVLCTTPGTGAGQGLSFFPFTDGLYLWNENMPQNVGGQMIAAIEDQNGNGQLDVPTVPQGEWPFGTYYTSLTSYPQIAFDASNTLYMSYSSILDNAPATADDSKAVRQVFVMKSCDGGVNFTAPLNIVPTDALFYEGMYASMAKNVDGNLHIVYQRDVYPGFSVPPATGADVDPLNLDQDNEIVYVKVPVADLGACPVPTGVKESNSVVSNLKLYPNPAISNTTIEVVLVENSKMDIAILNSVGQEVYKTSLTGNAGNNKVDINLSNLSSGLYFYQVRMENSKAITKKFVIEK